ncbi:GNAT family N-acetyltransferase [Jeongeupia chitinilytica]|uniref:N-acetyltransferase GCN5 n=1 Tax=Jeongeupia chitinilytica TaxID=1041641 RepID=A0ABQ3H3Y7_9NEIS|nr:GNAT family N-acetyltransferase [Jeongeupia chitinilytica]GHD69103.1 N-acetyltransferase GCN5 [Jeongeupia chitinilytica]
MTPDRITEIEALTTSAWPARATELVDGWVLRFANGYTKRANSVTPLYRGVQADADKLGYVEQRYNALGQPAIFKLTAAAGQLDTMLGARGYAQIDVSSVQTRMLDDIPTVSDPAVTLYDHVDGVWFNAFATMNGVGTTQRPTALALLKSYVCPVAFAALAEQGRLVACGFAVRQQDSVVLYDIVTDPAQRRRGHGRRLVAALLAWGRRTGAKRCVLQVVAANTAALALYASLGFAEQYSYWYRRQPR